MIPIMKQKEIIASIIGAAALACGVIGVSIPAAHATAPAEVSIPFINHGGIRDWRADGDSALYVQDIHNRWYHATLMSRCIDLPFAETIGFDTRGNDSFDRFASVVVRGQRCPVTAIAASAPPPKKAHRDK